MTKYATYAEPVTEEECDSQIIELRKKGPCEIFCPLAGRVCSEGCPAVQHPHRAQKNVAEAGTPPDYRYYPISWQCTAPALIGGQDT